MAIVRVPRSLPRIIRLPDADGDGDAFHDFVFQLGAVRVRARAVPGHGRSTAPTSSGDPQLRLIVDEGRRRQPGAGLRDELLGRG